MIIRNLLKVIKSKIASTVWMISWIITFLLIDNFVEFNQLVGNQWKIYAYIEIYSNYLIAILFAIFLAISTYKFYFLKNQWLKESYSWIIWSIASIIAIWCPACTITVWSYVWLSWLLLSLPFFWLEIKLTWIVIMIIWIYFMLKNLEVCKINYK